MGVDAAWFVPLYVIGAIIGIYVGKGRGYGRPIGALLGLLTGPVAPLVMLALPNRKKKRDASPIRK